MKERHDDPKFYAHVFYPKSAWKMIAPLVIALSFVFGVLFLKKFLDPSKSIAPIFILIGVFAVLFLVPLMILRLRELKKLQLGVGAGGIYIRGYGMLPWSEVKKIEAWQHKKHGETVKITTYSPIERGEQISQIKKIGRSLVGELGENLDEVFIFVDEFISTPTEELVALLRVYHQKYQQEGVARVSVFGAELPQIDEPEREISWWWIKIGILAALVLGSVIISLVRDRSEILINSGVTAFIGAVALFPTLLRIFLWVVSVGLILFGAGFFVYTLIWEKKPFWGALAVIGFGVYLVFILISGLLKKRKQKRVQK